MTEPVEKWTIFVATRYATSFEQGDEIDRILDEFKGSGHRVMVPLEAYEALESRLNRLRIACDGEDVLTVQTIKRILDPADKREYCPTCGKGRREGWNQCSMCGHKYSVV